WRVSHVEHLGAERAVVRDELDRLVQVDVIGVPAELVEHGEQNCGKRRQLIDSLNAALNIRQGQVGHTSPLDERFDVRHGTGKVDEPEIVVNTEQRLGVAQKQI